MKGIKTMKKSHKIIGGALAIIAMSAVAIPSVFAYQGDYTKEGPESTPERHASMTKAMEGTDYEAWKELMSDRGRVTEVVNEGNFARFAEAHRLGEAGNTAGADEIRKELGLRTSNGEKTGAGYGKMRGEGGRGAGDCQL